MILRPLCSGQICGRGRRAQARSLNGVSAPPGCVELVHIGIRVGLVPDGSGQSGRAINSGPTGIDPLTFHVKNGVSRSVGVTLGQSQEQFVAVGLAGGAVAVAVSQNPISSGRMNSS